MFHVCSNLILRIDHQRVQKITFFENWCINICGTTHYTLDIRHWMVMIMGIAAFDSIGDRGCYFVIVHAS
jgi:hypothetical protein